MGPGDGEGGLGQGWEARATVRALNSPDLFPLFFFLFFIDSNFIHLFIYWLCHEACDIFPIGNQACGPCSGNMESQPLNHQRSLSCSVSVGLGFIIPHLF